MAHDADATDCAKLYLGTVVANPGEHDCWRLAGVFAEFGIGGYRAAMGHAKILYAELHPEAVCLRDDEGRSCGCFCCRIEGLLAMLPGG